MTAMSAGEARRFRACRSVAIYSCPYRRKTSRQLFPTWKLCAARAEPQRSRLLQFMPPERSQNRAAAGLHGAKSCMSTACAIVADRPTKNNANTTFLIIGLSFLYRSCAFDFPGRRSPPDPHRLARSGGDRICVLFAFDRDRRQSGEAECPPSCRCYVDDATADKGTTVVDRDHDRTSVVAIGN